MKHLLWSWPFFLIGGVMLVALGDVVIPKGGPWYMHIIVTLKAPVNFETSKDCLQFTKTQEVQQSLINMKAQLKAQLGDEARFKVEIQCAGP